ncbi:MAG: methionyl-tRNA formyltransferase [Alphaproteobacteria bacterium]|nr:methionyl-tRNA formyltransferase [Alphaproteobacteria bacterium]
MKVVFMGTPDFSVGVLKALIKKHDVVCVYTQPPRPAGRGQKLTPSPVQQEAEKHGILVRYPVSLKSETEQNLFKMLEADVAVVCAYGLILPQPILDAFPMGCINVHASLLPRWRGAAPIQRAIMAGDKQSGVTIMQMEAGLDTGDMLLSQATPITNETTAGQLHDRLAEIGADLILKVLDKKPTPTPQPFDGVTYAHKITKEDCIIDWTKTADVISCQIRGLSPFPKAFFNYNGENIKVLNATVLDANADKPAGYVLNDDLSIVCGLGTVIRLEELQRPGKSVVPRADFLRGYSIKAGEIL